MEHWQNYSERVKLNYSRLHLSNCQPFHHKSHTDWLGVKPKPRLGVKMPASNQKPEPWQAYIYEMRLYCRLFVASDLALDTDWCYKIYSC